MTLPPSGSISFNEIRIELGIPSQSPFSLASASLGLYVAINAASPLKPNASAPYSISEWYGYDHSYVACTSLGTYTTSDSIPGSPSTCDITQYPNGSEDLYSNCPDLDPAEGCFIYTNTICTTTAYSTGMRAFMDGSNYYQLAVNSSINTSGSCA